MERLFILRGRTIWIKLLPDEVGEHIIKGHLIDSDIEPVVDEKFGPYGIETGTITYFEHKLSNATSEITSVIDINEPCRNAGLFWDTVKARVNSLRAAQKLPFSNSFSGSSKPVNFP